MISIEAQDCRSWLLDQSQERFQMAFADPPFGIDQKYDGFKDMFTSREMDNFTNMWIHALWGTVSMGGVMCLYHPVSMQATVWKSLLGGISRFHENTIVAHYNFGQCRDTDFIDAHCQCVILRKGGPRKFNPDGILIESERLKMGDKRVLKSPRKGMRVPGNVLSSPRVQGNNKERWNIKNGALVDHPNQLPLSLLKTLVAAYTDEGDSIIEPFAGSGGLALTCDRMNRNYSGCDISEMTVKSALKRVAEGHWEGT